MIAINSIREESHSDLDALSHIGQGFGCRMVRGTVVALRRGKFEFLLTLLRLTMFDPLIGGKDDPAIPTKVPHAINDEE